MNPKTAEILALEALGWLAGEEDGLQRFLDQSGTDARGLRESAGTPEMGVAILDFLLGHEDLLLRFCDDATISPRQLQLARHRLGGESA